MLLSVSGCSGPRTFLRFSNTGTASSSAWSSRLILEFLNDLIAHGQQRVWMLSSISYFVSNTFSCNTSASINRFDFI